MLKKSVLCWYKIYQDYIYIYIIFYINIYKNICIKLVLYWYLPLPPSRYTHKIRPNSKFKELKALELWQFVSKMNLKNEEDFRGTREERKKKENISL